MKKTQYQSGFSLIEGLLTIIALALIVLTGAYVYHNMQKARDSTTGTSAESTGAKTSTTQKYFVIKEWDVRAPYSGSLTLTYKIDNGVARFSAKQMDDLVAGTEVSCKGSVGAIARYAPSDTVVDIEGSPTAAELAKTNDSLIFVGGHYYVFRHPQSFCAGPLPDPLTSAQKQQLEALIGQASSDVNAITTSLRSVN